MSDFTTAFLKYYLTNPLIISILVLGLISAIFYKQIIGWFGEHWTKKALSKLPKTKYKIINNLLLSVNGLTHQIDHVIISQYGIFSIETKQYNGYITGSKYDKNWVRHAGKNKYYYIMYFITSLNKNIPRIYAKVKKISSHIMTQNL